MLMVRVCTEWDQVTLEMTGRSRLGRAREEVQPSSTG